MATQPYSKLFGCNVHDSIRVSPLALKIIDTAEFQRMRKIKQLALCQFIYPSATHTRFEHSLGVYHLAGKMLEKIRQQYPEREYVIAELSPNPTKLNDQIAEYIKIAGLVHDIGHGPFSHIFDDILLGGCQHPNKDHETRSCLIIDMLCRRELPELGSKAIAFIKSLINPQKHHVGAIYQIISNNLNGIDVDKFDYLGRDAKNLGLAIGFNPNRLLNEFIIDRNGNIAYPKHCSSDIYEMFHSRYMMHKKVYSHKTVKMMELMLADIFQKIDPVFHLSQSIEDMEKFCRLTDDSIFYFIQTVVNPPPFIRPELGAGHYKMVLEANELLQRIITRNLYQQVLEIDQDLGSSAFSMFLLEKYAIKQSDFTICKIKAGFVSKSTLDPFNFIYFYDKKENDQTFVVDKSRFSGMMNNNVEEIRWCIVSKNRDFNQKILEGYKLYKDLLLSI